MSAAVGSFFLCSVQAISYFSYSHTVDMFAYTRSLCCRNLPCDNPFIFFKLQSVLQQGFAVPCPLPTSRVYQEVRILHFLFYCPFLISQTIWPMVQAYVMPSQVPLMAAAELNQKSCSLVFRAPFAQMLKFKYMQCSCRYF